MLESGSSAQMKDFYEDFYLLTSCTLNDQRNNWNILCGWIWLRLENSNFSIIQKRLGRFGWNFCITLFKEQESISIKKIRVPVDFDN